MSIKSTVRRGLNLYSTTGLSRHDWLQFRKPFLGGSDMGTIMGINPNMSATELFYQKLGLVASSEEENNYTFWGKKMEDVILDAGQYLNVEDGSYIGNAKLRNLKHFNYMVNNPDYPWLLANIDGVEGFNHRWYNASAIAECKNISRQAAEKWETIPPYHFFQTQMYIRVMYPMLRQKRALLLYLEDGHDLRGYYIEESKELVDDMLARSLEFHTRVQRGLQMKAEIRDQNKLNQALAEIEPAPDHTKAWERYWSEAYKKKANYTKIEGDESLFYTALEYQKYNDQIKALDDQKQMAKNRILNELLHNSADVISFGDRGRITYNKRLYINIVKPQGYSNAEDEI